MFTHKGYTGVIEYDASIDMLAGHVIDLKDQIYFEGKSIDEARKSFETAVDGYLEVCEAKGRTPDRPFSGQLRLRMPSQLHRNVAVAASTEAKSMNDWIVDQLTAAVGG